MIGARSAALSTLLSLLIVVVKDKESGPAPAIDVDVGSSQSAPLMVILNRHEEYSVVLVHRPCFRSQIVCPLVGFVRKASVVTLFTPGVSDLDESDCRAISDIHDWHCAQDRVGVAVGQANFILILVAFATLSCHQHNVAVRVVCTHFLPEFIYRVLVVCQVLFRSTVEGSD